MKLRIALACATLLTAGVYAKSEKPNIIFFLTDDQSKSMFNFNPEGEGKNLCPHIDRLAEEGVILREHHVSSPVCTPSRFSCLTGLYASRSSCSWLTQRIEREGMAAVDWNTFVMPDTPTLPRKLQAGGYKTGFVGKNHVIWLDGLDPMKPKTTDDPRDPEVTEKLEKILRLLKVEIRNAGFDFADGIYPNNPSYLGPMELAVHNQEYITEAAVRFIDQYKDEPFYLYFATTSPHGPYGKKRTWGADPTYTAAGIQETAPQTKHPSRESLDTRVAEANLIPHPGNEPETILWIDDALGVLLDKLEEEKLIDNTIIIFLSDHDMMAKGTVYQGGAHTSALVWKKGGFPAGDEIHTFSSNVDFAPTLLDIAGINYTKDDFDGISFAPQLNGIQEGARDELYFEIGYSRGIRVGKWKYLALRYSDVAKNMPIEERQRRLDAFRDLMASQGKDSYLKITDDPMAPFSHMLLTPGGGGADVLAITTYPDYFDPDQLYNLDEDPNEQNNLAGNPEYADVLKRMQEALTKQLQTVPGGFPGFISK